MSTCTIGVSVCEHTVWPPSFNRPAYFFCFFLWGYWSINFSLVLAFQTTAADVLISDAFWATGIQRSCSYPKLKILLTVCIIPLSCLIKKRKKKRKTILKNPDRIRAPISTLSLVVSVQQIWSVALLLSFIALPPLLSLLCHFVSQGQEKGMYVKETRKEELRVHEPPLLSQRKRARLMRGRLFTAVITRVTYFADVLQH